MATDKVALRSVEEFMSDYVPTYQPIYPLFLGKSQAYSEEAGKIDFKRLNTVGSVRGAHIGPKDTEIKQVNASESSKTFKKYFFGNQFQLSQMQDQKGIEGVVAQVLDEHQVQMDELFLLGEGTSASTMYNNSLFWSADGNYTLETSTEVLEDADDNYCADMHSKVMVTAEKADAIAGKKLVLFYGTSILPVYNGLHSGSSIPLKETLSKVLGPDYTLAKMPASITPSGANGWLIANLDQTKLHYTALPTLKAQGFNEEKMYYWFNFMMGSCMLECLALNSVVRQPATLSSL